MTLLGAPEKKSTLSPNPLIPAQAWEWLPYVCEDSHQTMQRDRDLFESMKRGERPPYLRFYRWKTPTISFGRTHDMSKVPKETFMADGWSIVQRPTGGGTVLHQNDLCFSLAWTKNDPVLPWRISDSYLFIHRWIRNSLETLGVSCDFYKTSQESVYYGDALCFQNPVCSDLLEGGHKVVGGAQWRSHDAALHQGSIQMNLGADALEAFRSGFERQFENRLIGADNTASC